jgi:hypothetical protein
LAERKDLIADLDVLLVNLRKASSQKGSNTELVNLIKGFQSRLEVLCRTSEGAQFSSFSSLCVDWISHIHTESLRTPILFVENYVKDPQQLTIFDTAAGTPFVSCSPQVAHSFCCLTGNSEVFDLNRVHMLERKMLHLQTHLNAMAVQLSYLKTPWNLQPITVRHLSSWFELTCCCCCHA